MHVYCRFSYQNRKDSGCNERLRCGGDDEDEVLGGITGGWGWGGTGELGVEEKE